MTKTEMWSNAGLDATALSRFVSDENTGDFETLLKSQTKTTFFENLTAMIQQGAIKASVEVDVFAERVNNWPDAGEETVAYYLTLVHFRLEALRAGVAAV